MDTIILHRSELDEFRRRIERLEDKINRQEILISSLSDDCKALRRIQSVSDHIDMAKASLPSSKEPPRTEILPLKKIASTTAIESQRIARSQTTLPLSNYSEDTKEKRRHSDEAVYKPDYLNNDQDQDKKRPKRSNNVKPDVVRGEERKRLPAHDCPDCRRVLDTISATDKERQHIISTCSRHRSNYEEPLTPEKFWDIDDELQQSPDLI